jgi:hypothetical protein
MTDPAGESSFMSAADKSIKDLQSAVSDLKASADAAKEDAAVAKTAAAQAKNEATRWRKLTRWLGVFVIAALVASGLSIYNWNRAVDATNQLRSQAITSCENGNQVRAADVQIWNEFISILLQGNKNPQAAALGRQFEAYIAQKEMPRNCQQAYPANSNAANPSSLPPNVSTAASEPEIVQLRNWNGQCLTVVNANNGTRVTVVACGKAHDWWYYPEASNGGTFRPEGHASVAIGDHGGYAALVPVSSYGSEIHTDGAKGGPGGYNYQRLYIAPLGSHGRLHANGVNGATVSIQTPISNADFYALLGNINSNARLA